MASWGNTEPGIRRAAESVLGGFVPSRQHRFADFQLQGTLSGSAGGYSLSSAFQRLSDSLRFRQSTKYTCSLDVTAQAQRQRRATLGFTAQRSERSTYANGKRLTQKKSHGVYQQIGDSTDPFIPWDEPAFTLAISFSPIFNLATHCQRQT